MKLCSCGIRPFKTWFYTLLFFLVIMLMISSAFILVG
jgi:hypothetical protein